MENSRFGEGSARAGGERSTATGAGRSPGKSGPARLSARTRAEIAARLRSRRPEIEEVILTRASAVSGTALEQDPEYRQGLRAAIGAAVAFGLDGIERGEERCGPAPAAMLAQARFASRRRVGLQVVLRRYAAGYSALSDFLMQEIGAEGTPDSQAALYPLQRELTAIFDRLVQAASAAYEDESRHVAPSERHAHRIRRLLDGDFVDTADLDYDLDAFHLGAIAAGPGAEQVLREIAGELDRRLLLHDAGHETVCGWLGGSREFDQQQLDQLAARPARAPLAIGAPARGLRGWRLTHRQAKAAMTVAVRRTESLIRYDDVALLAAVLRDEDLVEFLTATYLAPLTAERDGGEALRGTLRAYFAAARNISSAAAALGVSRKTVDNRLRVVENHVGRHISAFATELELGLRIEQLGDVT
jgi:PucR C-terminal helix-turn-helix domain/GGDEF-like domain